MEGSASCRVGPLQRLVRRPFRPLQDYSRRRIRGYGKMGVETLGSMGTAAITGTDGIAQGQRPVDSRDHDLCPRGTGSKPSQLSWHCSERQGRSD